MAEPGFTISIHANRRDVSIEVRELNEFPDTRILGIGDQVSIFLNRDQALAIARDLVDTWATDSGDALPSYQISGDFAHNSLKGQQEDYDQEI